ncbi:hypothetical protein KR032_005271, partial [Drosophila birchii]
SPIPPAPSMKPSSSSWFTYMKSPVAGGQDGSDPRRSFNGSQEPRDPRSKNRDIRDNRDPWREGHNPRDPRMGSNQSSHGPQQHRSHTPSYSGDPRRGTGTYANMEEGGHWQSTNNGNEYGNKYTKPNWGGSLNGNLKNIPVSGFNGSASSRGGFHGGNQNPTMGHYGRPNVGPVGPAEHHNHVPRTYREHKEAKARADAATKAKLAKELRILEAEKQRRLTAVEKETKDKEDAAVAATAAALPAGPASAPAGTVPEPQLDTLYRNSTGVSVKKIDFRIPKKSPAVASSLSSVSCDGNVDVGSSASSTPSVPSSKSCDAGEDSDNNNSHKSNNREMEVTKTNDKVKGKDREKSENKKHHKKTDQKGRSSSKDNKKVLEKDKGREKESEKKSSSPCEDLDTASIVSIGSSENENLENEPPVEEIYPNSPINGPSPALGEEADEKLDTMAMLRGSKKIPTLVNGEVMENGVENNVVNEIRDGEAEEEKAEPPKLSKIKIVLGPNAHSQLLHSENSATVDNGKPLTSEDAKKPSDLRAFELFSDKHDDTEVPAPPLQELRRIMNRRYSMVPKASQPLVDKAELLTGSSLLYEDLQEQKRQSQRARNLAHIFEKTSDNCRISTQNIIIGKRRTRGGQEASFNETQLSRRSFGLGKINRSKRNEGTKASAPSATDAAPTEPSMPTTPPATDFALNKLFEATVPAAVDVVLSEPSTSSEATSRKRSRSARDAADEADENHQQLPQQPPTRKPRYNRRPKRNELDKLNEDIAMMYNGEEVLRATGRRACTQRSRTPSMTRISPPLETNSSRSSRSSRMSSPIVIRNVARRGKRYHGPSSLNSGLNRVTQQAHLQRCKVKIQRLPRLEKMVKESLERQLVEEAAAAAAQDHEKPVKPAKRRKLSETSSTETTTTTDVRNVNPDWHATSAATTTCVICNASIRKSPLLHYIQNHGEHYGARLPPGMLDELRAGRNQRPDYRITQGTQGYIYYYKCPFCVKVINTRTIKLVDHLMSHTGERRYQCSHCLMSQNRLQTLQDHIKTCAPGATVLNCGTLPISLNVCHLCEFVQISRDHMDRHLVTQHGLKKEELRDIERERVLLCTVEGVPRASSVAEGQRIKNSKEDDDNDDDERPSTSNARQNKAATKKKIKIRFQKPKTKKPVSRVKTEKEDHTADQLHRDLEISPETVLTDIRLLPLPPPEKEKLLVVNECLMDQDMDMALEELAEEEQALLDKDQKVDIDMDVIVGVNMEIADDPGPIKSEKAIDEPMETEPEKAATSKTTTPRNLLNHDISLSELDTDLLDGIGSDASDVDLDGDDINIEEPLTDEWIDLETAERNRKTTKNPFQSFTRFCSRLNKGNRAGRSWPSNASGSSNDDGTDAPDPSELMPRMRPLEPEATITNTPTTLKTQDEVSPPSQSSAAVTPSSPVAVVRKSPLKRVENVAYRVGGVGGVGGNCAAYYCIYPGCTFLFSNELEGLENHFAKEHPMVRWTGTCAMCPLSRKHPDSESHSIANELRHMTERHMAQRRSVNCEIIELDSPVQEPEPVSVPASAPAPEAAPLFKLRVRRFTGDRLAEPQPDGESQPAPDVVAAAAEAEAATGDQPNGMLRGLLQAEPRPPNQVDFNAAGLGEFLCAKPTTPVQKPSLSNDINTTASEQPTVINYPSGLGLAISQVFNGSSVPISYLESPPQTRRCAAPVPAAPVPAALAVNVPMPGANRAHLVADRFRCMAPNCGFCAHTVMCIRGHMKFHRFSFGSNDFLNCAYCDHAAIDVDDYIRHGILVHSLAPKSDLPESPVETPSVSQQIRDMLNQRGGITIQSLATQNSTSNAAPSAPGMRAETGESASAGLQDVSLPTVVTELLLPTGYSDDKLYACPQKGCIVRLTEEQFVNHVRYHIRSTLNQNSEQVKCKYCSQTFLPPSLRTHLQQAHARHKIFCSICLATAANKRLMVYHVRSQHSPEFEVINRQLQLIQLPIDPVAAGGAKGGGGGGTAAEALVADANSIYVAAVVQPFGKPQMERFQRQMLEELQLRRQGTKMVYHGSEVRLLPRIALFADPIRCAECNFSSKLRSALQRHFYEHKERNVREAYQMEESLTEGPTDMEVDIMTVGDNTATESIQGPIEVLADPPVVRPPGQHNAVVPKLVYVPPDNRYRCGFTGCIRLLGTELELRKHMTIDHSYSEETFCHHCRVPLPGHSTVDKYLAHLQHHKRHIYQCGACLRYNNKRSIIEQHIQLRHPLHDVDVVVHRHCDIHRNTNARWLKTCKLMMMIIKIIKPRNDYKPSLLPSLAKTSRLNHGEFICNLCQITLPTAVQIMAHAVAVHDRKYQNHCPYCSFGNKDASEVIDHILGSHSGRRVQPLQVYQQISVKKSQTLGFYCVVCLKGANSCYRIGQHCDEVHKSRFQWQCPHCDFGHQLERIVTQHLELSHPQRIGLAVMQFERVTNEIPDNISWEMGQPIEVEVPEPVKVVEPNEQDQHVASNVTEEQTQPERQQLQLPKPGELVVTEVVDLLASDDEREDQEFSESQEERKIVEFACTHCGETNSNLQDLRTQHWANAHPDQPFYFRVQPQLLCSECKRYRSNAKTLRDDHLLKVHSIRNIVACDVRRPEECAYCDYKYHNWQDLAQHISREGHLPNDLKNVTDDELAALQQLSASGGSGSGDGAIEGTKNEYFQCDLCSVVMPTKGAIAQHGRVEHNRPGERFCFRQLTTPLIYHCFFCMFTSADELTTLRHMVDHYNRFLYCHFCAKHLPGGFDEYIQHCYSLHREEVHRFRELHSYGDLRKFLINVHYQFQNGLIITKSSLRRTRFNDEKLMQIMYEELMAKVRRPPIRLHINLKSVQVHRTAQGQTSALELPPLPVYQPVQGPQLAGEQVPIAQNPPVRITKRRKTLNPDELLRLSRQDQSPPQRSWQEQQRQPPAIRT